MARHVQAHGGRVTREDAARAAGLDSGQGSLNRVLRLARDEGWIKTGSPGVPGMEAGDVPVDSDPRDTSDTGEADAEGDAQAA